MTEAPLWSRAEIESPCVKLCSVHPRARICVGCLRAIEEISDWSRMTPQARAAVMADLPARRPLLAQRHGGRAARLGRQDAE